jgi:hypothetical protein
MALKDILEDAKSSIKQANEEVGASRTKDMTGPERNIGPNMKRVTPKNASIADRFNLMEEDAVKRGGDKAKAKSYAKGGKVSSASKRADGCCVRGKTRA